ncbi:MAG: nucleotidyl transferase AbiEii/AbiGii toxin family protein [Acidimicrobiia bacterium]|nr:nucleotidyl transferase AbiEii/AbiGii toxin family protein [Acidimicrobiia bacterium]
MDVRTQIRTHPKVFFRAPFESGSGRMMRVKVEVNTFERSPARDLIRLAFEVDSPWFAGQAQVQTYQLPELVASKLRALYQRSKGRDLFDLWLAITQLGVNPGELIDCFDTYRPDGYTAGLAVQNLHAKVESIAFVRDLDPLLRKPPEGYDVKRAADLLITEVLSRL